MYGVTKLGKSSISGLGLAHPEVNSSPDPAPPCVATEKDYPLSVPVALLSMLTALYLQLPQSNMDKLCECCY